jgi:hypothetical protein
MWQRGARQAAALEAVSRACRALAGASALILVGSCARDDVDELSDIDLLLVAGPGQFSAVWEQRHTVSANAVWSADSPQSKLSGPGVHKWLTHEIVFVELLIGEPGQFRVADPFRLLWGDEAALANVPRRGPIDRASEFRPDPLAVARAYDELKEAVRRDRRG